MTVPALSNAVKGVLTRAGADNPDGDAREILCSVMGCTRTELILRQDDVSASDCEKALDMARRRASGEPIQYVLGSWSFMGRDYLVGKGVLIPRDDTEVAVSEALKLMKTVKSPLIADLCSGSGIIAITLSKELSTGVYAVEKSAEAYNYLIKNIDIHKANVRAVHADLADCVDDFADGSLDMIVSNPPYVPSGEIDGLQSEVGYEPRLALDGGIDGCELYRAIISLWTKKLKSGGYLALEIGEEQYGYISALLSKAGYTTIKGYPDIQGTIRAVTARSG